MHTMTEPAYADLTNVLYPFATTRLSVDVIHYARIDNHIGSTAIRGIKAKPIIDILVVIKHIKTIETFNAPMQQLGYGPRGECLDNPIPGTPGRFYFSKDTDWVRTHQVHVCQEG